MITERWPRIGPEHLRRLWDRHAPSFLRLDDVEEELPILRDRFLSWLETKGIDIDAEAGVDWIMRRRLRIESVALTSREQSVEALVCLSLLGRSFEGRCRGLANPDEMMRVAASATIDAINSLAPAFKFGLEKVLSIESPPADKIALVVVDESQAVPGARYLGAAPVKAAIQDAAAQATLNAVNRRLETVLT